MEIILYILTGMAIMLTLAFIYCSLQISSVCDEYMEEQRIDEELDKFIKEREELLMSPEDLQTRYWEQESVIADLEKRIEDLKIINEEHQKLNGMLQEKLTKIMEMFASDEHFEDGCYCEEIEKFVKGE